MLWNMKLAENSSTLYIRHCPIKVKITRGLMAKSVSPLPQIQIVWNCNSALVLAWKWQLHVCTSGIYEYRHASMINFYKGLMLVV